ncbi:MAG TPA: hypothetical protein VKV73_07910 [Chloroflexota bacterium]|nr:hypothetical protein [Chloroflexota bacterium]
MPQSSRVPTGAVAEQLPGVSVIFQSKPPHSRFDVVISSPVGQALSEDFSTALTAIGFNRRRRLPQVNGVLSESFEREGSGLCGGWSATERDKLTRDARATLRRFGFTMVPEVRT